MCERVYECGWKHLKSILAQRPFEKSSNRSKFPVLDNSDFPLHDIPFIFVSSQSIPHLDSDSDERDNVY